MTSVADEHADKKYGEAFQYDPEFKGPIKNRSCTDILCLFLFLAFIAGWVVVAIFAFKEGNPELLLHPTDSQGQVCGMDKLKDKPYLFFFDLTQCAKATVPIKGCQTPQVCVEHCPIETSFYVKGVSNLDAFKKKLICKYNKGPNFDKNKPIEDMFKDEDCASYYLKSAPLAERCLPSQLNVIDKIIKDAKNQTITDYSGNQLTIDKLGQGGSNLANLMNAREVGERIFQDFSTAWWIIILFLVASMVISFIWILLMRWIAGPMVFISIVLVMGVLGFASGFCFYTYYYLKTDKKAHPAFTSHFVEELNTHSSATKTWLAIGIIVAVVWLILILMLIFLRKRILLAVALIKEGSKAVGCIFSSLFFPLFPYLLQLVVFVFWGSVAVYIASARRANYHVQGPDGNLTDTVCDPTETLGKGKYPCLFKEFLKDDNLMRAQIYNLFGLFWAMFFVVGIGQVSLAGAFASYYWAFDKTRDVPSFAVIPAVGRCFRYHLGSVAFGSVLIAIVRMIRVALEYIDQKLKKYNNTFTKVLICCCKCCFWCLEKFMKFISKNAYIMMAVYGKNFCWSAKESFSLLMRNVVRVVVLDKVTDYLLLLGKLVVVGLTGIAAFFFFSGKVKIPNTQSPELNYYFLPIIVVTIGAYLIASGFFNVYSMAVDTLFLSFLEDCERNDGSEERPYYMSKNLMKILGKKNKFREA